LSAALVQGKTLSTLQNLMLVLYFFHRLFF